MSKDERLMTKREVAEYLGVATRTVERLTIPRVRIPVSPGKRPIVRFDPVQVEEWLDKNRTRSRAKRAS